MNPLRNLLHAASALGLLALGAAAPAQVQPYVQKTRTIRAAVVLLSQDSSGNGATYTGLQTAAPYAFYNLDNALSVKPGGWTFVNPFAPGVTDVDVYNRFKNLSDPNAPPDPSQAANRPQTITKRNAPYWTVRLSQLSDAQTAQFDILLLAPRYRFSLTAVEREKLRRFVDGGGVLWVDPYSTGPVGENGVPFAFQLGNAPGTSAFSDSSSPLINGLRQLTGGDLNSLNFSTNDRTITAIPAGDPNAVPLVAEFARYRGATFVGGLPTIASARLGDGTIVVTPRGAAALLNQGRATGLASGTANASTANVGYRAALPDLGRAGQAAARLAVNIVSMGGDYRQTGGGPRKLGSAAADPGSPVQSRFTAEGAYGPLEGGNPAIGRGVPVGSPVTYKGFLVATIHDTLAGNYRVAVFDATPGRDLDGDGDSDDGIVNASGAPQKLWRDTSIGKPLDVVWMSAPSGTPLSPPVCAEVPENNVGDVILVTGSQGQLLQYALAPRVGGYQLIGGSDRAPFRPVVNAPTSATYEALPGTNGLAVPLPPTVYDGLAYLVAPTTVGKDSVGVAWVVDLSTGGRVASANPWLVGGPGVTGNPLGAPTASPSVAYIPIQDAGGGQDRVMYVPGYSGGALQPTIVSLWLGAKGERPRVEYTAGTVRLISRAGLRGALPFFAPGGSAVQRQMGLHVSITDANGNPVALSAYMDQGQYNVSAPGVISFTAKAGVTQQSIENADFRLDYSIDWGTNPNELSAAISRGRIILPIMRTPVVDPNQRILGPVAVTPRGTMHFVQASQGGGAGGTYWAMREDIGNGAFRVVSKYSLVGKVYDQPSTDGSRSVPPTLDDADGVRDQVGDPIIKNLLTGRLANLRFVGGVSVRGGIAYTAINAEKNGIVPVAIVAAFRAEPETPELRIGAGISTSTPRIGQVDWARSDPNAVIRAPLGSTVAGERIVADPTNGTVRLESLATAYREEILDSISLSQPITVDTGGGAKYRNPDSLGDRWSPLLWFALWNGGSATGAPLVAGNQVFLAASSGLPNLFKTGNYNPMNVSGVVWSVDADISSTDKYSIAVPGRPWIVQAAQILPNAAFPGAVSPHFRMPQNRGAEDFADWVIRLEATTLGTSTTAYGLAGGDGAVAAWGDRGLYGMSRADFVVCDEGRLLRVDSSGNPISNAFGGLFSGIGGGSGAATMTSLVRPVKAYPVGQSDTLVVDAGANRVMRLGGDGEIQRSLDRIVLDPNHKPDAYRTNDPLTFNDPRDAATYEGYVTRGADEAVTGQAQYEYWVRYIVADSGNGRIVELVDRYTVDSANGYRVGGPVVIPAPDPETGAVRDTPQVGVLVWQSPKLGGNVGTYYNSVSRVYLGGFADRYVYVAGVSRSRPTRSTAGLDNPNADRPSNSGGGAVVVYDPQGGTRVFDRFATPDLTGTAFGNPATVAGPPARPDRPFTGLTSVSASTIVSGGAAAARIVVSDADAVYEFAIPETVLADPNGSSTLSQPSWFINEAAYTSLRSGGGNAKYFRPAYARRLDSGEVLVVNGYRGLTLDGSATYSGEVSLFEGLTDFGVGKPNLGFKLSSVRFDLRGLTGVRDLVSPVFADRR